MSKYKAVICAVAKNEQLYINEWVKYHINIGFDKIYLFDNDELGKFDFEYIGNQIDLNYRDKVEIINRRGIHEQSFQTKCYKYFYENYNTLFDWCLFCDIDEFLFGINDIKSFVDTIPENIGQIRVKWQLFGDDNIVERDLSQPVHTFFKQVKTCSKSRNLKSSGTLENQGKFLLRGNLQNIVIRSPHFASINNRSNIVPSCLPSGKVCNSLVEITENYANEKVYLNHYMTKTLSEFIIQKIGRGDAISVDRPIDLDYFWRINDKTKDKLDWLKKHNFQNLIK